MKSATKLQSGDALVIVDVQNDFLPGGALAVPRSDEVVPMLIRYIARFLELDLPIFATRDWHSPDHRSLRAQGGPWLEHGVADTTGAAFTAQLASANGMKRLRDQD